MALNVDADDPREAEIGLTLSPDQQGKGYATESVNRRQLHYALGTLNLHRIIALTDALNEPAASPPTASERVGRRTFENTFFEGSWGSEFLFALLRQEWSSTR